MSSNVKSTTSLSSVVRPEQPLITCVIPGYNESANLAILLPQLVAALSKLSPRFSVLVVDDGSSDDTVATVTVCAKQYPVQLLSLSRNFGKEFAIAAGLDHAAGDVVFLMDADLQHPVALLSEFFSLWHNGYDMVYGIMNNRSHESSLKRFLTRRFYAMLSRAASIDIPLDAGDFRLFDRCVVDALKSLPERTRYMKGLYAWVGFKAVGVPFVPAERVQGHSSFNLRRLSGLALTGITSFSELPLRVVGLSGAVISLLAIGYGVVEAIRAFFFGVDVPGWATLVVGMAFLGGIQLFSLGVVGEYVGRIFNEVKSRPRYIVAQRYGFDSKERKD
jgi:glycosyltransferase involved in cell wall biosynthesis